MPHEWKRFRKEWRPIVAGLKKPYHATLHKKNPRNINEELARLIEKHIELCVAVTVSYTDYKAVTTPQFRSLFGSEYSVGAMQAIFEIERWAILRKKRWVAYVFEKGHKNSSHLKQLLGRMIAHAEERRPFRIYSQAWLTKEELILHPPDLVAFEVASSYGREPTPIRAQLGTRIFHHHMQRDEIAGVVHAAMPGGKKSQRPGAHNPG